MNNERSLERCSRRVSTTCIHAGVHSLHSVEMTEGVTTSLSVSSRAILCHPELVEGSQASPLVVRGRDDSTI